MDVRYPNISVQLTGIDGNAFMILGTMMRALRRARLPQEELDLFMNEAKSGDYDHLLQTCMKWVDVN